MPARLPLWLAPVQVVVLNITERQADYAQKRCAKRCKNKGLGCSSICATRKLPIKYGNIRLQKLPYHAGRRRQGEGG